MYINSSWCKFAKCSSRSKATFLQKRYIPESVTKLKQRGKISENVSLLKSTHSLEHSLKTKIEVKCLFYSKCGVINVRNRTQYNYLLGSWVLPQRNHLWLRKYPRHHRQEGSRTISREGSLLCFLPFPNHSLLTAVGGGHQARHSFGREW